MPIRCSARRKDGQPCQAWAVSGSAPPLCPAHRGREPAPAAIGTRQAPLPFSDLEPIPAPAPACGFPGVAAPAGRLNAPSLADELAAVRAAVRRIVQKMENETHQEEYAELAGLLFRGTVTIAQLLSAQKALSGEAADGYMVAMAQVLTELGDDWQVEL